MNGQMHETATPTWTWPHRVAFRFFFAYLILYFFPFPEAFLPGTAWLTDATVDAWNRIDVWVGAHLLGLGTISTADTGSGDRACNYVQLLCIVVLSTIITLVWSIADRRRTEYAKLDGWLRVYVRYVLAFTMLLFGVVKLLGGQFVAPSILRLVETYGETSPQTLLWTFMGASAAYTFFAGAMEVIGGVLLYFRRTTTLGALIVAAVMTNVVMMNLCYDVPVKQFSLHLLAMAMFLLVPDLRRLADFFVLHRAARLPDVPLPFSHPRLRAAAYGAKVLLIGSALYRTTTLSWESVHAYGPRAPKHPLNGYYEVQEFVLNGEPVPPLLTESNRWRSLAIARRGFVVLRTMTGSKKFFMVRGDAADREMKLVSTADASTTDLRCARPDPAHLVIEGRLGGDAVVARMTKVDETSFPLVNRPFRWIKEESD